MSLSFDDKESFIEAAGSLRINNPPSDSGSSSIGSSTNPQDSEKEDICFTIDCPSDPQNTIYPTYKLLIISRISFLLGRFGCGGINEPPIDSSRKEIQVSRQYRFNFAP